MAKRTYRAKWGADVIEVTADWAQASCPVDGAPYSRQVASFRHSGKAALRAALENEAQAEGLYLSDPDTQRQIDDALDACEQEDA